MTPENRLRSCLLLAAVALASCAGAGESETAAPAGGDGASPEVVLAFLLDSYDADHDGRISRSEYGRTDAAFANLDQDGDGAVDARDLGAPAAMPAEIAAPFLLVRRMAGSDAASIGIDELRSGFGGADADGDDALTRDEWAGTEPASASGPDRFAVVLSAADGDRDGRLALPELERYLAARDRDGDGRLHVRERLTPGREPPCGWFEPEERERAPDFTLPREDGSGSIALSSFRGKKPVALIFGSFT